MLQKNNLNLKLTRNQFVQTAKTNKTIHKNNICLAYKFQKAFKDITNSLSFLFQIL